MTRRLPSKNSQISGEGRPCVRRAHLRAETQGSQPSMAAMSEQSLKDGYEVASLTWGSIRQGLGSSPPSGHPREPPLSHGAEAPRRGSRPCHRHTGYLAQHWEWAGEEKEVTQASKAWRDGGWDREGGKGGEPTKLWWWHAQGQVRGPPPRCKGTPDQALESTGEPAMGLGLQTPG